ncbi:hypothetical protein [Azospirillum aestuarii]|uniref:hypothetical protein n=1 Tax=Azospirillum aestuarii TaxID=2802052 RepID=UPI004054C135
MFDEAYACWGLLLLRTLAQHHPEIPVIVVGIDITEETSTLCLVANSSTHIWARHVSDYGADRPVLIANARPLWLREILTALDPDWCLFLDADMILRRRIDSVLALANEVDAALVFREGLHKGRVHRRLRVAAGLVFFSRGGYALVDRWCRMLQRTEKVEDVSPQAWFWEQVCLFDAAEASLDLRLARIDAKHHLSSPPFSSSASFWSANVKPHQKLGIYREFQTVLENSNA